MRHQKVHGHQTAVNAQTTRYASESPTSIVSPTAGQAQQVHIDNGFRTGSDSRSNIPVSQWQFSDASLADVDLNLIWPDSEDLFQSILSADLSATWQVPPGTLPLPAAPTAPATVVAPSRDLTERISRETDAGDNHRAVHGVSQMVSSYSSSITAAVEATPITSVFLDASLHMFFNRFIPILPIMHRPTFIYRECSHPLLLNAIAIGSLYLGPEESVAKGEALWRLAHTAVATSWQSLIAHQGPFDACAGVQLVLAALLSVIYGALSKDRTIRLASQAMHASAFFWGRQCGIFDCQPYDLAQLPPMTAPMSEKTQQWREWAAREIQQRALLSHFVLDGLIAHPTSTRHTLNTLKLPGPELAFQETTVDRWLERMHSIQQKQYSFRDIYRELFGGSYDSPVLAHRCSTFALRVLLEGLQSMIADSDPNNGAIVNPPSQSQISCALLWIYEKIVECTDTEVDMRELLLRWHAVCLESLAKTPQLLCNYICKRWNVHQTLWPNNNLREKHYNLPEIAVSVTGRRALLHAIAIQEIVQQLPRGRSHAVHMPSSLFAAATIYGVFAFAGQTTVRVPDSIDWSKVVNNDESQNQQSDTARFVQSNFVQSDSHIFKSMNLLYELNSLQKFFSCLATQWGVSADMENIIKQWILLCR